ncbi:MAG TPA: methylthioribulose 1-phosphate dehydratase [Polyangiaceae bacterium]|nr:methylthioribulose 1-phosphate dehydratase [Polyangiaceae bacterium]
MTNEPNPPIADEDTFVERLDVALAGELAALARFCHAQGWARATSGNFSARVGEARVLVTASGVDKGAIGEGDFALVNLEAKPEGEGGPSPSAEAPLHCAIYRRRPGVLAVAHTHSVASTVLSRHFARRGALSLRGYEMAKALGARSHETTLVLPILENSQDALALARAVEARLDRDSVGYLIEGHGLTTWGPDVAALRRHVEALEFLLACELASLSLPPADAPRPLPPRPSRPGLVAELGAASGHVAARLALAH